MRKPEKKPIIIIPYSDGDVIFKIVDDLTITDELGTHIADHPNVRFRYLWNLNRLKNHVDKMEKRLNSFLKKTCSYWAYYLLLAEDQKPTTDKIEGMVMRAWSDEVCLDEDEIEEYVDLAIGAKYTSATDRLNNKLRDKISKEMYPEIVKDDDFIWFRGLETETAEIDKWKKIISELEISVECLKDKGFSLSSLKDLKMEGLLDLYASRKRVEREVKEKFQKKDN